MTRIVLLFQAQKHSEDQELFLVITCFCMEALIPLYRLGTLPTRQASAMLAGSTKQGRLKGTGDKQCTGMRSHLTARGWMQEGKCRQPITRTSEDHARNFQRMTLNYPAARWLQEAPE